MRACRLECVLHTTHARPAAILSDTKSTIEIGIYIQPWHLCHSQALSAKRLNSLKMKTDFSFPQINFNANKLDLHKCQAQINSK